MRPMIITNTDSGAGCVKASSIADRVVGLGHELVFGPAPLTTDPLDFFSARASLQPADAEDWEKEIDNRTAAAWRDFTAEAEKFERVELWMDPDPNAQLQLMQILDWLRRQPEMISKLLLVHADEPIGGRAPDELAAWRPDLQPVKERQLELATIAWRAYRHPTPS